MIQTETVLKVADNSGAKYFRVITVLGGTRKKYAYLGDKLSGAVQTALPNGTVKDHQKVHAVVVRTRKEFRRKDGTYIRFDDNAVVLIDKSGEPIGSAVFGPIAREVRDAGFTKISSLAPEVL